MAAHFISRLPECFLKPQIRTIVLFFALFILCHIIPIAPNNLLTQSYSTKHGIHKQYI